MDFRIGYRRPLRSAALLRKKRQRTRVLLGMLAAVAVAAVAANREPVPAARATMRAATPIMQVALNSTPAKEAGTEGQIRKAPALTVTRSRAGRRHASTDVASDPSADGALQNASFEFGDEMPSWDPTQSGGFPGIAPTSPASAEPYKRGGMPSVPMGAPSGMGLLTGPFLTPADTPATPATPVPTETPAPAPAPIVTPPVVSDAPVITLPPVSSEVPVKDVPPVVAKPPVVDAPPKTPVPPVTAIPPTEIPEPGTLPLIGAAFLLMLAVTGKRARRSGRAN